MKKRKWKGLVLAVTALASSLAISAPVVHAEDAWQKGYTYNYDYWGTVQYCPDAYNAVGVFTAADIGLDTPFNNPEGMFVRGDRVYICDTGNNRIIEIKRVGINGFELVRVIDQIRGDVAIKTFNSPTDVFVSEDGHMYICDKNNNRILKVREANVRFEMEFTKPTDETFDQDLSFLPNKLAVDAAGRVYCIAVNVNKGLIKFESDGAFIGFHGATKVIYDWMDYIWKKLSTKEQRAAMESFVPTEYDNVYMDSEGFVFACTTNVKAATVRSGQAEPVRRLNLLGNNILIQNGNSFVIGDIYWDDVEKYTGPSLITDLTALDSGIYFILDKVRGRIFGYDTQGNMLYAFGGVSNTDGCFTLPIAIDHMGNDLLVLDTRDRSFTLFSPTTFGNLIYQAIDEYDQGDYEKSGKTWEQVMAFDGNYDLAYIGIGRALMRQGEYKEAMSYFKSKWDTKNYSKAFQLYRKQWVEKHIGLIFAAVIVLFVVPMVIGKVKKIKFDIDTAEIFKSR